MRRYIFIALLLVGIFFGLPWAIRPFLSPPQGLMPTDWTYVQLIRDRYPFHLVAPTWVSDEFHWIFAETATRFGVVVVGVACFYFLTKIRSHEKPSA